MRENSASKKEGYIPYWLGKHVSEKQSKLLKENNMRPIEVVEMVSSPNGTTVAGRKFLESGEFKKIISETVTAARKRSEELGR